MSTSAGMSPVGTCQICETHYFARVFSLSLVRTDGRNQDFQATMIVNLLLDEPQRDLKSAVELVRNGFSICRTLYFCSLTYKLLISWMY